MKTFGQRIKELRKGDNLSQDDLISFINIKYDRKISKSMLSKWENDKEEPSRFSDTVAIAKYFGVTTDYLLGLTEEKYFVPDKEDVKSIPIIGTIAAGYPIFAEENITGYEWVSKNINIDFCLRVKGNSMIGARIYDNDIVYIRKQQDVENGEIAVVIIDGEEATLKRVYKAEGTIILRPENPNYKDLIFSKKDFRDVKILGKESLHFWKYQTLHPPPFI